MNADTEWLDTLAALPNLPPEEIQRGYVGQAGRSAFEQALKVYSFAIEHAAPSLQTDNPVFLDFGCGWGRFSQVALKDFPPDRIWSVDASPEAIALCQNSGLRTNLVQVPSYPPTQLKTGLADLILAYSVFSHLREDYHLAWLDELKRLLKPGGTLVATFFGTAHINYLLKSHQDSDVGQQLANGGADDFASGKFVFLAPHIKGPLAEFFGHAFIPKQFLEREWARRFSSIEISPEMPGVNQVMISAR